MDQPYNLCKKNLPNANPLNFGKFNHLMVTKMFFGVKSKLGLWPPLPTSLKDTLVYLLGKFLKKGTGFDQEKHVFFCVNKNWLLQESHPPTSPKFSFYSKNMCFWHSPKKMGGAGVSSFKQTSTHIPILEETMAAASNSFN